MSTIPTTTPVYYVPTTMYGSWQSMPSLQTVSPVQQMQHVATEHVMYYINNAPYYCYPAQPNVLYPVYYSQQPVQTTTTSPSLEEYVKQTEQQPTTYC